MFYELYGFNSSGLNQDFECSQFTLSGRHLEEVRPLIPLCAPAMQQRCKLKDEKSGSVWEEGVGSEGRGGEQRRGQGCKVNERGRRVRRKETC